MIAPLVLAAALLALWGLSLQLRDASIVDLFWGPAFVLVAWLTLLESGPTPRAILVAALVSLWGLRLGAYLTWRNWGHGEDKRYVAMRERRGASWWWKSLFIVFGFQGLMAWIVSWPVRAAIGAPTSGWSWTDALATLVVLSGVAFESIGDLQLAAFKRRPENRGQLMRSGLWRYTRHPNYFGDFLTWWGLGLFGAATGQWWTLAGPLVMSVLLLEVSGKKLLEEGMKTRPGYAEYEKATSGFFPWWPR